MSKGDTVESVTSDTEVLYLGEVEDIADAILNGRRRALAGRQPCQCGYHRGAVAVSHEGKPITLHIRQYHGKEIGE